LRSLCRITAISTLIAVCLLGVYASVANLRVLAYQDPSDPSRATALNFEVYKQQIEPLFLRRREGDTKCYDCHSTLATQLRLQRLAPGGSSWTEEQSRQNFEIVSRLVIPGEPTKSPLPLHPLTPAAGGDPTRTDGKFWETRNDPEWKMIAEWFNAPGPSVSRGEAVRPAESTSLDFDFFVARVEPIFLKKRAGHARCYVCHSLEKNPFHLEPLSPGASSWTNAQSLLNFKNVSVLVVAVKPTSSPLAMHPLAPEAGGDPFHSGGRQFRSQDDEDWKTIAEWIRGSKLSETVPSQP
jgi:hypothetical protein